MTMLLSDTEAAVFPEETRTPGEKPCILVIFNPVSGQGDPEARKQSITDALAEHGCTCEYLVTTPKQGARHFAREAVDRGVELIAVSGGDGTILETMTALIGTQVALAVLPAGTGNLMSVNLGLPHDTKAAVEVAMHGQPRRIDFAQVTATDDTGARSDPQYFAILAGAGYDAWVIRDADRQAKRRLGMGAYLLSALRNLHRGRNHVSLRIDGAKRPLRRRAKSVMVANMGTFQGNVEVIPGALPDDGVLEVALLKAETLRQWIGLVFSALRRRITEDASVEYFQARRVDVELSIPQPMQFDGELADGRFREFSVEVVPKAVKIMTPAGSR
jgi:YegS/Rv2252/BmrU family lipid kinase